MSLVYKSLHGMYMFAGIGMRSVNGNRHRRDKLVARESRSPVC